MQTARQWRTNMVGWALSLDRPSLDEPALRVDSIMSKTVFTCCVSDTLNVAAQIMWDHDCGCVPVLDEAGRLRGVITDRDVCMAGFTQGKALTEIAVGSACSLRLCTCHSEDLVVDAMQIMFRAQVRRLPVVDGEGKLVGILSLSDLVRHLCFAQAHADSGESAKGMASLLVAVSRPRTRPEGDLPPMSESEKESLALFDTP